MVNIEKRERNKLIYEEYEKNGKQKGGISFARLGKKHGISNVTCRRIYFREKVKRTKNITIAV